MARLPAVHPDRLCRRYSVVPGREFTGLISGDRLETGIHDRLLGVLVKQRVADISERRLCDGVVLLLEGEPNDVANSSRQGVWLVRDLVRGGATDNDLVHLLGSNDRDEGNGNK